MIESAKYTGKCLRSHMKNTQIELYNCCEYPMPCWMNHNSGLAALAFENPNGFNGVLKVIDPNTDYYQNQCLDASSSPRVFTKECNYGDDQKWKKGLWQQGASATPAPTPAPARVPPVMPVTPAPTPEPAPEPTPPTPPPLVYKRFKNKYDGQRQCLDLDMGNKNINVWWCHNGNNQKWAWTQGTKGELKNKATGECLTWQQNGFIKASKCAKRGDQVMQWGSKTRWFNREENLVYRSSLNKCLDWDHKRTKHRVITYTCHKNAENQKWVVSD